MKILSDYPIRKYYFNKPVFQSNSKKAFLKTGLTSMLAVSSCGIALTDIVEDSEVKKFEKLKTNLSTKLEPAIHNSKKANWDFYTNSNDTNLKKSQEAYEKIDKIFHNEKMYKNFLAINNTKLPKHEAKQLKEIIKSYDDELNAGGAKKALRDKENEIAKKNNSYIPILNGKEVTKLELSRIMEEEAEPKIRKQAYDAKIKGGDLIADDLIELFKMRNEYAKSKGYETYFDYSLKENYDVDSDFLDKLIEEIYSISSDKFKNILQIREKKLKDFFSNDKLENYHYGLLLNSDPEKGVNNILKDYNIEDIVRNTYSGMGYNIAQMIADGRLTLDLYPRKNKNAHGFCFGIERGKDTRILANLRNNYSSLTTLCHEMGHGVYNLGISPNLNFFDKDFSSMAFTEAIAMMMEDLPKKENVLETILPNDLLRQFKRTLKEDDAYFVARSLEIIEFERDMYKNPKQNLKELWKEKRKKYLHRDTIADNEWATIPHCLSHPGYYQNYFRAALMKAQIYNHLVKVLGNITENKNSAEYINKNIFAYGASIDEYDLIKKLCGEPFSSKAFVKNL